MLVISPSIQTSPPSAWEIARCTTSSSWATVQVVGSGIATPFALVGSGETLRHRADRIAPSVVACVGVGAATRTPQRQVVDVNAPMTACATTVSAR